MKLEAGKHYKTRDGKKAFVRAIDPPDRCTKLAYVDYEDGASRCLFMDGRAFSDSCINRSYALVEEWNDENSILTSPIQKQTVKKLVSGVYGCVTVGAGYTGELRYSVSPFMTTDQLRAAAKTFVEIAEYLEEKQ